MAHAYWRLLVTSNVANNVGTVNVVIGEVGFFDSDGNYLCTGGTAIADSIYGVGSEAANAFDGDEVVNWGSAETTPPHYIGYHFASAVDVATCLIAPWAYNASWAPNLRPKTAKLQYSDDGSTWVDASSSKTFTYNFSDGYSREPQFISSLTPGTGEYFLYKFHPYEVTGSYPVYNPYIAGLQYRETIGGSDVAQAVKAFSGSQWTEANSGYSTSLAFDGNSATWWEGKSSFGGTGDGRFVSLIIALSKPRNIAQLALTNSTGSAPNGYPTEFKLFGSNDNVTWTELMHETGITWTTAPETLLFPSGTAATSRGHLLLAAL